MKNSWFHIISFKLDKPCVLSGNQRLAYAHRTPEEVVDFSDKLFVAMTRNEYKCDFDIKQSAVLPLGTKEADFAFLYSHISPNQLALLLML